MMPEKSLSARAEGFGRTERAMAAPAQGSDLDFVFPPAMKGFRRQMLAVSTGGDVCRVLKRSSDGWMRPRFTQAGGSEYPVASRFHSCNATVYDRMPPVQHLRGLPLQWRRPRTRPGTAAAVRISAGLDCEALSPLGSVVMPGSASVMPQTAAWTHA